MEKLILVKGELHLEYVTDEGNERTFSSDTEFNLFGATRDQQDDLSAALDNVFEVLERIRRAPGGHR